VAPKDKLALAMSLFVIFFLLASLLIPWKGYVDYVADLKRRKRAGVSAIMLAGVYILAPLYAYDELVGLDIPALSLLVQVAIGACAYGLLIDIALFAYRNYGPPSHRPRPSK
jgi:hypothetical protein